MPIKVDLCQFDPATIPTIEVELPDRCPECSADLTEPDALIEAGFLWSTQHCHVEPATEKDEASLGYDGANQDQPEESHVLYYMCAECEHIVACPPGPVPPAKQPPNASPEAPSEPRTSVSDPTVVSSR